MNRPAVIAICVMTGLLGLGSGYWMGRPTEVPVVPEVIGTTGQKPDAPNAIGVLAATKAGAPAVPTATEAGGLRLVGVSFAGGDEACAESALAAALAEFGGPGPSLPVQCERADHEGTRLKLASRPMPKPSLDSVGCVASLRASPGGTVREVKHQATGATGLEACERAGRGVLAGVGTAP